MTVSPDRLNHYRKTYTALDWMGDVGGLYKGLLIVGLCIVQIDIWIRGNQLHEFLLEKVFKQGELIVDNKESLFKTIARIEKRKPFTISKKFCVCLRSAHERKLYNKGLNRTRKILEADTFLKM